MRFCRFPPQANRTDDSLTLEDFPLLLLLLLFAFLPIFGLIYSIPFARLPYLSFYWQRFLENYYPLIHHSLHNPSPTYVINHG